MKKSLTLTVLLIYILILLAACSSPASGAKTTQELAERYLAAIMNEDYEAILALLPEEVVEYGKKYVDGDRDDVVEFVRYAAYDYYWLAQLPTHVDYTFEIIEEVSGVLPAKAGKEAILLEEDGVKLYVQDSAALTLSIDAGAEEPFKGSLFALKIENRWYLISVAGDDELFKY